MMSFVRAKRYLTPAVDRLIRDTRYIRVLCMVVKLFFSLSSSFLLLPISWLYPSSHFGDCIVSAFTQLKCHSLCLMSVEIVITKEEAYSTKFGIFGMLLS
ncbi:unnamed protein product [Auanema sp. JU1783]|nr:unnamed protein product [Auanema sp. JU1783]